MLNKKRAVLTLFAVWTVAAAVVLLRATQAPALIHEKPAGEPYALGGKRMMFSNWTYVRTGQLDWKNAEGKSVYASGDSKLGPDEARFDYYDKPFGLRLTAEPAERRGPIIARERPWEAMGIGVSTVIHEDGRFRMWGGSQAADGKGYKCYFESTDGINWERPNLQLVEYDGNKDNNLFAFDGHISVFRDPSAPPEERYKAVWDADYDFKAFESDYKNRRPWSYMALETDPGRVHSIRAAVSPDGFNWKKLDEPISVEPSDTHIICEWDAGIGKYLLFTRSYFVNPRAKEYESPPGARRHQFVHRRAIGRAESDDFRNFPLSDTIVQTEAWRLPTDTYYSNCKTTMPGAPDQHLMFPGIYHQSNDTTSIDLFSSNDTKLWTRLPGSPVLEVAPTGQWDSGCLFTIPQLLELPNGDWALPYVGYVYPHKYPRGAWGYDVGMAVWPKGRLIALEAPETGQFTTMGVIAPGARLKINALTDRAGSILVEAAGFDGAPIEGRSFDDAIPIVGNHHWTPVRWNEADTTGVEAGEPIVLRFRMKMAKIYGLEFE